MEGVDFDVSFAEDCNTEAPTDHRDAERLLGTGSGAGPVSSESVHELLLAEGDGAQPEADAANAVRLDLDVTLVDDRSYLAADLQRLVYEQLQKHRTGESELQVFSSQLTYRHIAHRKLEVATRSEWKRKPYIVDAAYAKAIDPPTDVPPDSSKQPDSLRPIFNMPSIRHIRLLDGPNAPGNTDSRLGYLGCDWRIPEAERKRKASTEPVEPNELDDTFDPNPAKVKAWAFYLLSGDILEKMRTRAKGSVLDKSEVGPALYLILPSAYEPVSLRRALRTLLSEDFVKNLRERLEAEHFLSHDDGFAELSTMLHNLYDNTWADWAWDSNFVKPSLRVLTKFAFTHKHMPGVQSQQAIDNDKFDQQRWMKAVTMYQELFLQYLDEHECEIAALKAKMVLLETDGGFLQQPPPEQDVLHQQREGLREEMQGVVTLRSYQLQAVELCLASNHIINLPTGSGKTMIAVKLIDFFIQQHPSKNVIFVVPTRALVVQQAQYIRDHSDVEACSVVELSGFEPSTWDETKWLSCKRDYNVLVGTAEIFRQSLVDTHFLSVSDISLCVFDECHNAVGNHSMANMMKHIGVQEEVRPRIVGLTASFANGKCDDLQASLIKKRHELEELLQSIMWAPSKEDIAHAECNQIFVRVEGWASPPHKDELGQLGDHTVQDLLAPFIEVLSPFITADSVARQAAHVLVELGMQAFVFYLEHGIFPELEAICATRLNLPDREMSAKFSAKNEALQRVLPRIRQEMAKSEGRLEQFAKDRVPALEIGVLAPLTAKAARLMELLDEVNQDHRKKGIIFVKQRALLFPLVYLCRGKGHSAAAASGVSSMTENDRNEALTRFRRGHVSLLIATDALEEGIDVADCEFVIRFNLFGTTKSHIQGSGRARKQDSKCYYFENNCSYEQLHAARLAEVARDSELALSDEARAARFGPTSTDFYPFKPGGSEVNLSNAKRIFLTYCTAVMKQNIDPKVLCRVQESTVGDSLQQFHNTLQGLRYPSPEGWQELVKDASDSNLHPFFLASGAEVVRSPEYKGIPNWKKDALCFFYVAVVLLRQNGWLDERNKATALALTYSQISCAAVPKEHNWSIKPRFRAMSRGLEADTHFDEREQTNDESTDEDYVLVRPVRSSEYSCDDNAGGDKNLTAYDKCEPSPVEDVREESHMELWRCHEHSILGPQIAGEDMACEISRAEVAAMAGNGDRVNGSSSAPQSPFNVEGDEVVQADKEGEMRARSAPPQQRAAGRLPVQELKTHVDRGRWTMRYEEEQEACDKAGPRFRARVVLVKDIGDEVCCDWSDPMTNKKSAKHAAAEIALASFFAS